MTILVLILRLACGICTGLFGLYALGGELRDARQSGWHVDLGPTAMALALIGAAAFTLIGVWQ